MARKSNIRAAAGAGSIRQRPDGRWEGRLSLGADPGTGKQIRKSVYGATQKEVRKRMTEAIAAFDAGNYFEPSKLTLGEWLDIWLSEYMGDKKYSTKRHYKAQVITHIKPALGATALSKISPHIIQKFYNDLLKQGRTIPKKDENGKTIKKDGIAVTEKAPLSAKSVRNVHGILTKALSVAVQMGYIRDNPADRVTLPRVEKKEIHPLTDDQVKAFLAASVGDEYESLLKVILFTGLREAEAMGLTWDCVDFKTGTVTICKQLQKRPLADGGFTFAPLKNDKTRVLKPAPFVMGILSKRWKDQAAQRLLAGDLWEGWQDERERKTALVFTTATGGNFSPQTVLNHYKKIAAKIGIPESRVHDLRHTFAVLSLQNGDDIKTVQGNLGHATAAFTLDVYGHVSERMKEDSAARMEAYINGL